jgi:trehalose 6-phosphate phosphatase
LISGRAIADIDDVLRGVRFPAAGQHGTERRDATGGVSHHALPSRELDHLRHALKQAVAPHRGLVLEDKGLSLALHYRRAPRLGSYVHRLARAALAASGCPYSIQTGKRVVELRPAGRDKGVAVLEFMQEPPFHGRTPVFVGDDVTDEFGFATVNRLHGHSVKVGPGRTAAHWRLRDVRAVRQWLRRGPPTA